MTDDAAAKLAAIKARAERESDLARADELYEAGEIAAARELWEQVAASGHPSYAPRATARLEWLRFDGEADATGCTSP